MHIDFMVVIRLVLLKVKEAIVEVHYVSSLTTCLEVLHIRDHEWTVDFVLRPSRLVEVATARFGACKNHLVLSAISNCLQFKALSDRQLLDSHLEVITVVNAAHSTGCLLLHLIIV